MGRHLRSIGLCAMVVLLTALAACNGDDAATPPTPTVAAPTTEATSEPTTPEPTPERTTPPTPEPTPEPTTPEPTAEPTDPFAVPEEIDTAYVQAVFDELLRVETDMIRAVTAEGELGEVYRRYLDSLADPAWAPGVDDVWRQHEAIEFSALNPEAPYPPPSVVTEVVQATPDCVYFIARSDVADWFTVDILATPEDDYARAISPVGDDERVDQEINPTGWRVRGDATIIEGGEFANPCGEATA